MISWESLVTGPYTTERFAHLKDISDAVATTSTRFNLVEVPPRCNMATEVEYLMVLWGTQICETW